MGFSVNKKSKAVLLLQGHVVSLGFKEVLLSNSLLDTTHCFTALIRSNRRPGS